MNTDQPLTTRNEDRRAFLHSYTAGALLPLMQSTITALVVGVMVYVLAVNLTSTFYPEKPAVICAVLAWGISWLYLYRHWFTLTRVEQFFNIDLNGDEQIGDAPTSVVRIQLDEVRDGHYKQTKIFDLPASESQLSALAAGLLNGSPFSERFWTGTNKPFTSATFRALRTEMLKRGLIELVSPKDPRQGYGLTRPGRGVMRHYVPSPAPLEEEA